jgi:ribosomal-protein-alanine N-acetyltransferase
MEIKVRDDIFLTEFRHGDQNALVEWFKAKEIYQNTFHIPYPYTRAHADEWINRNLKDYERRQKPSSFAIRNADGLLIGGAGLMLGDDQPLYKAEIGYWIAKPYWGQNIATDVVKTLCQYGVQEFGLVRITAHIYLANPASARVVEKCGFELEGVLRKSHLKDGTYLDSKLYSFIA